MQLTQREIEYFNKTLKLITKEEIIQSKVHPVETIYDLIDILLLRIPRKNIENMSKVLQDSLQPSISLTIGDDLNSFCVKIGDSPSLIFEQSIQKEMENFIKKRFDVDKKILSQKTADIARLISLMNKYLGDAIDSSANGSSNVANIKEKLNSFSNTSSTKEDLDRLQTKLVEAAISIENEMNNVNENLKSGQEQVTKLENKIAQLEKELQQTKASSRLDHLTGVLNRRSYEEELSKVESLYQRTQQDYAVVFFDIDHFKNVNDTYGHDAGDIVLKTFSTLLKKLTRDTDILARYGGEEFIATLHYQDKEELHKYISRIKSAVTSNKFLYKDQKIRITFSAGVTIRSIYNTKEEAISDADKLLYEAKNSGRNKIIFWDKSVL